MTQERRDGHSTEFGLWLREQQEIDSKLGFVATNIDYVWRNYKTGDWMLIEEKRYGQKVKFYQQEVFDLLNWCCKHHPKFCGFHTIVFEKTSPDDGAISLDGQTVSREQLISFLKFDGLDVPEPDPIPFWRW